jgi:hypothetical protein
VEEEEKKRRQYKEMMKSIVRNNKTIKCKIKTEGVGRRKRGRRGSKIRQICRGKNKIGRRTLRMKSGSRKKDKKRNTSRWK